MTMLEGIRIVDLTTVIFGPYATQMLADLGAEVIKVETPGTGDISRYLGSGIPDPTMGSIHLTVNRGKRSIALDLKKPDDAAVLRDLIATADVFFHNVRGQGDRTARLRLRRLQGDQARHHLCPWHRLRTGWSLRRRFRPMTMSSRPRRGRPACSPRVDGNPDPRYFPSLIADKIAGQFGAQAILAALDPQRCAPARGSRSRYRCSNASPRSCSSSICAMRHSTPDRACAATRASLDPTRQPFPTRDGYLAIVPYTPEIDRPADDPARQRGPPPKRPSSKPPRQRASICRSSTAKSRARPRRRPPPNGSRSCRQRYSGDGGPRPAGYQRKTPSGGDGLFSAAASIPTSASFHEMQPPVRYGAASSRDLGFAPRVDADGAAIRSELGD